MAYGELARKRVSGLVKLYISNSSPEFEILFCTIHAMCLISLHSPRYPKGSLGYKRKGLPLAGGWSAILFTLQGDMDYFASVLKLPKWQTKKKCCVLCQADAEGHNSWKNFDTSAPWVSTCWTPQTWHLFPGKSPCKLLSGIPGASAVMCSLDFMHNKYLGVDIYIFGSCLHLGINSSNVLLLAWQAFPHWWHPQKNKPSL